VLDHYLAVGGNEVVNSSRAYGYASTADCAVDWLIDPECHTLGDVEDNGPYTYANIDEAPWYDADDPDTSSRFYGLLGIDILGLSDSTRQANVVQLNGDGATVTGYRHAAREVRVRAWMTALGDDALELGMTWLRNVLEPNACGQHGGVCGEADAAFFVDCPPARRTTTEYTDWTTVAVNRARNPIADASWTAVFGGGTGLASLVTGLGGVPARRVSWTTAPTASAGIAIAGTNAQAAPIVGGQVAPIAVDAAATSGVTVHLRWDFLNASDVSVGTGQSPDVVVSTNTAAPTRVSASPVAPATATKVKVWLYATDDELQAGSWISGSRFSVGLDSGDYFDGDTEGTDLIDYSWTGTVNDAPSNRATRTTYEVPEGDDTYIPYVDTFRRFLHSVRCVSGPFVVQDAESSDGVHVGRLVEFTLLAGVPWVYGLPKEIEVPPLTPTVVQDIAYNLAPYPSAELDGGLSANPDLATNTSGWTGSIAALSGAAPASYFTTSRVDYGSGKAFQGRVLGTAGGSDAFGTARATLYHDIDASSVADLAVVNARTFGRFTLTTGEAADAQQMKATLRWLNSGGTQVGSDVVMGTTTSSATMKAGVKYAVTTTKPTGAVTARILIEYDLLWNTGPTGGTPSDIRFIMNGTDAAAAIVVATNYSTNPSVETNITGWTSGGDAVLTAGGTVAAATRSTAIALVGVASALAQFTATAAGTNGKLRIEQAVTLGGPAGARYSVNLWATASVGSGTASIGSISYFAIWRDGSNAVLRTDALGSQGSSGGSMSVPSLVPPAGATNVIVRAELAVTSWASAAVVRLYADTLAVTVP